MRSLTLIALLCALAIWSAPAAATTMTTAVAPARQTRDDRVRRGRRRRVSGGGAAQTLKLTADPGGALKFDKSTLSAKAGKVTIVLDNPSSLPHAVEIEGNGIEEESDTIGQDETTEVTATVKAGEYEYYCPVDGHKAAGMEGTLTVQ